MRWSRTGFVTLAAVLVTGIAQAQAQTQVAARAITTGGAEGHTLHLRQVARVGSIDGEHDAFGRVMDAALDRRGRILVVDDQARRVAVFSPEGRYVGQLGRRGRGPGEFESPWLVAADARDSIFVWDVALARVSVFGPDLAFHRSFAVRPQWVLNSLRFLPDGRLLVAAYGRNERGTLHILSRTGDVVRTFGPSFSGTNLAGFESSLLGGSAEVMGQSIVYSTKSPYEVWFYDLAGNLRGRCAGQREWTTTPASVVRTGDNTAGLQWKDYVHSYNIVSLGGGLLLNQVLDPAGDRTYMDVLTPDCRLLRRTAPPVPLMVTDAAGSRLVAVRNLEFPEVVVYEQRVAR